MNNKGQKPARNYGQLNKDSAPPSTPIMDRNRELFINGEWAGEIYRRMGMTQAGAEQDAKRAKKLAGLK